MIKVHENSKLLRVIYPFARLFGGVKNLRGGAFKRNIYLWGKVSDYEERVIWHEVCHVCQYEKYGVLMYWYYHVKDWFTGKLKKKSGYNAYKSIRWEQEAYDTETELKLKLIYPEYLFLIESVKTYL
jgi:hypothetical protein